MALTFRTAFSTFAVAALILGASGACAAEPAQRAARLVSLEGTTQIFGTGESRADAGDVQINMPLLEGSHLSTGEDGRAEIEFEDGSIARLTPNSEVSLDSLAADKTEITVAAGLTYLELRADSAHPYAIHYGASVVRIVTDATIRVNVDQAPGELAVFGGEVVVANGQQRIVVHSNEMLRFDSADSDRYVVTGTITQDSWDQWNEDQDAAAANAASQQSDEVSKHSGDNSYGWSDLDAYGNWYPIPDAGDVWQPADAGEDFNPYEYGTWGWYPGFGYTWISGYPWGWTPFRCGGWSYFDDFGWGWQPGSCFGWGTGIRFHRPPPGFKPPAKPIGPPKVIRLKKHPVVPPGASPRLVARVTPVQPVRRNTPVVVNGAIISPLPRRPVLRPSPVGGDPDSPILATGGPVMRRAYPRAEPGRIVGSPARIGSPSAGGSPIVTRIPAPRSMPVIAPSTPVHVAPAPAPAPHVASPPSASPPSHK